MRPSEPDPASGILLIAEPMVHDANFRRTVILLCEHGPEGSFGLVLNRPLDLQLGDVLAGMADGDGDALSLGGPVQPDTLHFLHRYGEEIPGAVPVLDGVSWGGNFEQARAFIDRGEASPLAMRFFLGYAGWSPGQLEDEVEAGGWILAHARPDFVFTETPDKLWRYILRSMGGDYAILANFPDDPRMN